MHCVSCSNIIESRLKKTEGINEVEVSYATETAKINYDENKISTNKIYEEIEKSGYKVDLGEVNKEIVLSVEKIKIGIIFLDLNLKNHHHQIWEYL